MRTTYRLVLLVVVCVLAGCYNGRWDIVMGYPSEINGTNQEIRYLEQNYFGRQILDAYGAKGADQQAYRDEVVLAKMRVIDFHFEDFQQSIHAEYAISETVSDSIPAAFNLASLLTPVTRIKDILSILSTSLISGKNSFDENMFFSLTMQALELKMLSERARIKKLILENLAKSVADYSLQEALLDLDAYERAGTFHGAVQSIALNSATEASIDMAVVQGTHIGPTVDDRVIALNRIIDTLGKEKISLVMSNSPGSSNSTNSTIVSMFGSMNVPEDLEKARFLLKTVVRSEASINAMSFAAWETAIQALR